MALRPFSDVEYFEDYQIGDIFRTEPLKFDEAAMIEYARECDPQPFHIDHDAAAASQFGGMIASGGHTFTKCWGHLIKSGFLAGKAMGAQGVDEMRWPTPVRPGDYLTIEVEVIDIRLSNSRTDRGYVTFAVRALNQEGRTAMTLTVPQIIARAR